MNIEDILRDEAVRRREFPITAHQAYFGHAGVSPLPAVAVEAMREFAERGSTACQENEWSSGEVRRYREAGARLVGCSPGEISLLGPTALGLNLVAKGLKWQTADEVVYYADDYPSNVYPWSGLESQGVRPIPLHPERPGEVTWDLVERALSPRTKLVSLASCHYLTGYRIDVDQIGKRLHERDILFNLDAIQTLGAFPISVEHVDFLSADSHKWLLGPLGAGIFYVHHERREILQPALVGAWNVVSPDFIAQDSIDFEAGGRRYEPGALNVPGICGMRAAMELLMALDIEKIGSRLLELRQELLNRLKPIGYRPVLDDDTPRHALSGIVTVYHPDRDMKADFQRLKENGVFPSLRADRHGRKHLRFAPHFYNTDDELDQVARILSG